MISCVSTTTPSLFPDSLAPKASDRLRDILNNPEPKSASLASSLILHLGMIEELEARMNQGELDKTESETLIATIHLMMNEVHRLNLTEQMQRLYRMHVAHDAGARS